MDFGFTTASDEVVYHRIDPIIIEDVLNEELLLKNYCNGINEIIFLYMGFRPDCLVPKKEYKRFKKRDKILDIGLKLDYERLVKADREESLKMMAQLYLDSIKLYPKIRMPAFDHKRFYKDVKQVFIEKGWIEEIDSPQSLVNSEQLEAVNQ